MKKVLTILALLVATAHSAVGYTYELRATNTPYGPSTYNQVSFPYGYNGDILVYTYSSNIYTLNANARAYGPVGVNVTNTNGYQPYNGIYYQFEVWVDGDLSSGDALAAISYN
jgi:hypothetical protein